MMPTMLAACVDVAMDDAYWASRPALMKRAATGSEGQYDDGMVNIGGVQIPSKVLYGLAMGGLAGGAGGIAGGFDPKSLALIAALGAAAGGLGGYGLHQVDKHTESDTNPAVSRADARVAQAKALADSEAKSKQSGGVATVAKDLIKGDPTNATASTLGTAAQIGGGAAAGNAMERTIRAVRLNNQLARPGSPEVDDRINRILGVPAGEGGDYSPLRKIRDDTMVQREGEASGKAPWAKPGISGQIAKLKARTLGVEPGRGDFASPKHLEGLPSGVGDAMRKNFQMFPHGLVKATPVKTGIGALIPSLPHALTRNRLGTGLGALAAALPSLGALTAEPGKAGGVLPMASLINSMRSSVK